MLHCLHLLNARNMEYGRVTHFLTGTGIRKYHIRVASQAPLPLHFDQSRRYQISKNRTERFNNISSNSLRKGSYLVSFTKP